jgi:MarR family 2-MHQ and catechol resistance regulon transcriptional repressor
MSIPRSVANPSADESQKAELAPGAHPLKTTPEEATALRLWVILSRAQIAIAEHAGADVARHGLTLAEFAILEALYHGGPLLLGEVQRRILVSSGGITFLVDRLTAKGLVERRNCPGDRRARYAALTPQGTSFMAEIFPQHVAALTKAMSGLSSDQRSAAADLLRSLGLRADELMSSTDRESAKAASA